MVPLLPLFLLLLSSPVQAGTRILLTPDQPVRVYLDGLPIGEAQAATEASFTVSVGGNHMLKLVTPEGGPLFEGPIHVPLSGSVTVLYQGGEVVTAEESKPLPAPTRPTTSYSASSSSSSRSTSGSKGSNFGQVAGAAASTVGTVVLGPTTMSTISYAVDTASRSGPSPEKQGPAASKYAAAGDRDSATTRQPGAQPATGDPTAGMVPVMFTDSAGQGAVITIDGGVTVTLTPDVPTRVVNLNPGLHTVQILDSRGARPLYRGHLDARPGDNLEVSFSATMKPACSEADRWW